MLDDVIEIVIELLMELLELSTETVFRKKTPQEKKEARKRKAERKREKVRRKAQKRKEKLRRKEEKARENTWLKKEKKRMKGKQTDPLITLLKTYRKWKGRKKKLKKELSAADEWMERNYKNGE